MSTSASWTPPAEGTNYKVRTRVEFTDGSHGAWDESDDTFTVLPASVDPIPTVSQWGMSIMTLLVLVVGTIVFRVRLLATIGKSGGVPSAALQRFPMSEVSGFRQSSTQTNDTLNDSENRHV